MRSQFGITTAITRKAAVSLVIAVCLLGTALSRAAERIVTYDAPGAGTSPGQGTTGFGISPAGTVAGSYIDSSNAFHAFVRTAAGVITTFDAPGAGTGAGQGTQAFSINAAGAITGYYTDATELSHGFVRNPDGAIITFDAPGAGRPVSCPPPLLCSNGTQGVSINTAGAIAGQYVDTSGVFHGFLRSPNGSITSFDAPGAGAELGQGTLVVFVDGINPEGAIAAGFVDPGGVVHPAIRNPDGTFTEFDISGSAFTDNSGITPNGTVASFFIDAMNVAHSYVRDPNGTITLFDIPGAGTGSGQGTETENIDTEGVIAGVFIDASGVNHGFLRAKDGRITTFDVPGAGTGVGQGTIPFCNNSANAISGVVIDASGVAHGFLRIP